MMRETAQVIEALKSAVEDALEGRPRRPEDFKLISAVRTANDHMRRLAGETATN